MEMNVYVYQKIYTIMFYLDLFIVPKLEENVHQELPMYIPSNIYFLQ